jgi:hypothetical protein
MTVSKFIDHMVPGDNAKLKALVKSKGVSLAAQTMKIKLNHAYTLADCLQMNAPDCVAEIIKVSKA